MANKKGGSRPRKRNFHGNQFTKKCKQTEQPVIDTEQQSSESSSAKKIRSSRLDEAHSSTESTSRSRSSEMPEKDAFILMNVKLLTSFITSTMRCFECKELGVCCELSNVKSGFSHSFLISCPFCLWETKLSSSEDTKLTGHKEVNLRMAAFVRSLGRGYSGLEKFSLHLNSPRPMTKKSYRSCIDRIKEANKVVAEKSMKNAAEDIRLKQVRSTSTAFTPDSNLDTPVHCAVSVDGTWQKRGHASHHGVVTAISVETGKCLDVEILTNICKKCQIWEKRKGTLAYDNFKLTHSCKINHVGSAGAMEGAGCVEIFSRSEKERNLRYTQYLGDGDSSSYKKVIDSKPYGEKAIEKLECVGHVQKRVGTRLRRLKNENKSTELEDGKKLGGLGRLTDKKIDTLQNYYGFAIRQNHGDLTAMVKAVGAVLPHVASSKDKPMHENCQSEWCGFIKDPENYKHKNGIPPAIVKFIQPVFKDLSEEALLRKCLHGKTQNANECLNKLIWDRCQKEIYVEKEVIEDAVYSAVSHFNDGTNSIIQLHQQLGLKIGFHTLNSCQTMNAIRIKQANKKSEKQQKQRRKTLRALKKGFIDKATALEGDTYSTGGH